MEVTGRTALYGVIGDPIGHVRAPAFFNRHLAEQGLDGILVPLQVAPADLERTLDAFRRLKNLKGFLVTLPHKEAIVPLLQRLTPVASRVGAVNIVRREEDGSLTGGQLDGEGFVRALRRAGRDPRGRRVFILGAGGVATGIGFALAEAGAAALTFRNRSPARAGALAERIAAAAGGSIGISVSDPAREPDPAGCDIVINATSLGLKPEDPLPIDPSRLERTVLVADVVMAEGGSALLKAAAARGLPILGGEAMAIEQLDLMLRFMG